MADFDVLHCIRGDDVKLFSKHTEFNFVFMCSLEIAPDFLEPMLKDGASVGAIAAYYGACECMKYILSNNIKSVKAYDTKMRNLLHFAAAGNCLRMFCLVEKYFDDMDAVDSDGWNVVHFASRYGKGDVLKYLMASGMTVDACTSEGDTALHLAVINTQVASLLVLMKHGCDMSARNRQDKIPLMLLKYSVSAIEVLDTFIANGCDLNAVIGEKYPTILWYFVLENDAKMVDLLLQKGCRADVPNSAGFLPCQVTKSRDMVKVLEKY